MDSASLAELESWRVGELESWRVGELESWRVGDPRASDSEKTTSLYGRAAAGLGFEHARHAHLTAKKRHLSTVALRPGWDSRVYIFTQPRAAKQTGHTSYTHTGARGGGLQDYIHTQVPEVPCVCVWRPSSRNAMN